MHLACHARMESLTVGWRGPALQGFDVGGYRDRFNVFKVPVPASFTPGQKLLDRAVISGPCVRVADRHRKKLEELFLVDAPAAGPFMFSSQFANIAQFAFTRSTHRKFKSHWLTLAFNWNKFCDDPFCCCGQAGCQEYSGTRNIGYSVNGMHSVSCLLLKKAQPLVACFNRERLLNSH
jgi:hypothetical protein